MPQRIITVSENPLLLKSYTKKLMALVSKVANIGISPELDFHEKTKTQILNIAVTGGMLVCVFFTFVNLAENKMGMVIVDVLLALGSVLYLIINSRRRFLLGRVILAVLSSLLFTASAVLYRNGNEYFLIVNFVIIAIYFNDKRLLLGITFYNILLFIGVKLILNSDFFYATVPLSRVIFNISWAFLTMLLALAFFKYEQIAYQKQVEAKNQELEKLNDTKKQLFSIIAHDLRSPIGQLKGSLDLVNKGFISAEKFKEVAFQLSTDLEQLQGLMDNLLKWSLGQLNGIQVHPEKTQLNLVLEKVLVFFSKKLAEKNISLNREGVGIELMVDPDHLELVLRNLLSNALKYSYRGGKIVIKAHVEEGMATIAIKDKGLGMNEKTRASIFVTDGFASTPGTENEKGTGLGLKLCKEFIEKNQGTIRVVSSENEGSTFYVSLPATS